VTRGRRAARLAAALAAAASLAVPATGAPRAPQPCGSAAKPPRVYAHVIWVMLENHPYGDIVGNREAPYLNALTGMCGLATRYDAIAHPSLPNYVALTSGSTQGITDDADPSRHPLGAASIFDQARTSGSYEEGMPANCSLRNEGRYAVRHNPETYFLRVRTACRRDDVPLGTPAGGAFARALDSGRLPAFSFVTPDLCDDMHDCSVATGDAWVRRWLGRVLASRTYRAGRTAVFLTWDEGDSASNRVALIAVAPTTPRGSRATASLTHYSLLRTTEEMLGIRAHLGAAAAAPSMRALFRL
jgi:phosphatidylinositol-3-phosphatase